MQTAHTRTILLTGGTGFLGRRLLSRLLDEPVRVILLTRSSSVVSSIGPARERVRVHPVDAASLDRPFREERIDLIVHCAVDYGRKNTDPGNLIDANLLLPLRLLALAKKHGVPCFLNTDTVLAAEVNQYALSKSQFREWLKVYAREMTCVNAVMELFYGPGDREEKFVTRVVRSLLRGDDHIDLTRGEQKRDFLYIDDAVEAFLLLIRRSGELGKGCFPFEIGSGRNISIRECVLLARSLSGNTRTELHFGSVPYREHELMESRIDTTAINGLGWSTRVSLEEGLRRTIEGERLAFDTLRGAR